MSDAAVQSKVSKKPTFIENGERADYTVAWLIKLDQFGRMDTRVVGDGLPLETQLAVAEALQKQLLGQVRAIKAQLREQKRKAVKH